MKTRSLLIYALFCIYFLLRFSTLCEGGECARSDFVVAVDAGHTKEKGGATSAAGVPEYSFNIIMAESLIRELKKEGYTGSFLIGDSSLEGRAAAANQRNADLLLSIHHDSVQQRYLSKWIHRGRTHLYCDRYKGFSIFTSQKNGAPDRSLLFARLLGAEMLKQGLSPSLHHAERTEGENRQLLDREKGIYRDDGLVILKGAFMPAVLLECGIIVNRREEKLLRDAAYRMRIVTAIRRAITAFCAARNFQH